MALMSFKALHWVEEARLKSLYEKAKGKEIGRCQGLGWGGGERSDTKGAQRNFEGHGLLPIFILEVVTWLNASVKTCRPRNYHGRILL